MDYNKLMEELDKEVRGAYESVGSAQLSATEGYDDIEKDLMANLDQNKPIVEVDGEEDLIFEDEESQPEGEEEDENESAEDLITKSVKTYFEGLINDGVEAEEASEKVLDLVKSVLPEEEGEEVDEGLEEVEEDDSEEDSEEIEKSAEAGIGSIPAKEEVDQVEPQAQLPVENSSFEEYQKDKEIKMLNRYKQLANKDEDKKKVAIEGLGELDLAIDDKAISRVSGEFGYSGKNLRKMVAEAIQKGEI